MQTFSSRETPGDNPGAIYRELGVEPIINGNATLTMLGGSLMPPEVLSAMREAAECFVDLVELQGEVGRQIAALTRNEAAFVCPGAAAGLVLASIACMTRKLGRQLVDLHDLEDAPREFVLQSLHRNPYDPALELAGGKIVEIGSRAGTSFQDLDEALSEQTAAVVFVPNWPITNWPVGTDDSHLVERALPFKDVVELAHSREVPVIVDAAAQLPARENLWRFTAEGADLVIFSGGKGLRGPASSGLILGRRDLIDRIAANSAPLHGIGRPLKVGKEEMIGLLYAVQWYLNQDQDAVQRRWEAVVQHLVDWGNGRDDVTVVRDAVGPDGQPIPRAHIRLAGALATKRDEILARLRAGTPRIALAAARRDGIWVNPQLLQVGEEQQISAAVGRVLEELRNEP
jgi:D-glucosaminate-6-phosphate ammonia-lyase